MNAVSMIELTVDDFSAAKQGELLSKEVDLQPLLLLPR